MPSAPPLVLLDAAGLAAHIGRRKVSCREVMEVYLDHIDRVNPSANAIVSMRPRATLLGEADAADAEIAAGRYRGWMHGLPQAVKDLAAAGGMPTTYGSPLFAGNVSAADAIAIGRMRSAGAIFVGRTNVPEFGYGSHTANPVFGVTRNAYDPSRSAGGSSGGAAVALALRMLPVADGSDYGGSLRNPAGWNNVFGFRPSFGRVPYGPSEDAFFNSFSTEGPMARTVTDLALLLSVMAGRDDRAPLSLADDPAQFAAPLDRDVKGVRIGWLGDLGGIPTDLGMLDLCEGALRRLEQAGCVVGPARLGVARDTIWQSFVTLRQAVVAGSRGAIYDDPAKRALLNKQAVWEIEAGRKLSAGAVYAGSVQRTAVYQAFLSAFETWDFLALPTAQVFPFDAALEWPKQIAGVAMDSYHRWMEIVAGPTLAGLPALAAPAGFSPAGLPSGIQLIGPPRADFAVLQLARAYEQAAQDVLRRLPPALAA